MPRRLTQSRCGSYREHFIQRRWVMSPWNSGGACWNFLQRTEPVNFRQSCSLLCGVLACFAFFAQPANGFAEAYSQGGDRLETLLCAPREASIIFSANFGKQ